MQGALQEGIPQPLKGISGSDYCVNEMLLTFFHVKAPPQSAILLLSTASSFKASI